MLFLIPLISLTVFCFGIWLLKTNDFWLGLIVIGMGMVLSVIWNIPEPSKRKYKLKERHLEEIEEEIKKDSLIRDLTFLENERTEELVEFVNGLSFEDALIVVKSIESKYPQITIGRGITL